MKLGFFSPSPVHYQAPLYRLLAVEPGIDFTAIFASSGGATRLIDNGYARAIDWGSDLLSGYRSVFLRKAERNPISGGVWSLHDFDIVNLLLREHYDVLVLHGYHTVTHFGAALTQRALGRPVMFRTENRLLRPHARWKTGVKSACLRPLLRGSYGLFIGSENRRWLTHWGVSEDRLYHVPYVVDNARLQEAAARLVPHRERLRTEFGLSRDSGPAILTVSRLIAKKQTLHLLDAFKAVRSSRRCTLLVVGSGPLEAELRRKVDSGRIPDVVFAGFIDQARIPAAYVAADIFALVSRDQRVMGGVQKETWGIVVNEAMNFALPVVVSDQVGCAADLVADGRNGYVVSAHDVSELARRLEALVASRDLRQRLGGASFEMIGPWTYERAARGVLDAAAAATGGRLLQTEEAR